MRSIALILLLSISAACTFSNENGKCIGAFDDREPGKRYEAHGWNVFWAVLGCETLVIPAVWLFTCFRCPVNHAPDKPKDL